jgi:hypothetical protein
LSTLSICSYMFSIRSNPFASWGVTHAWSVSSFCWSFTSPWSRSACIERIIVELPFGWMNARFRGRYNKK